MENSFVFKALVKSGTKILKKAAKKEVKKETKSGIKVTKHGVSRKIEREVKSKDILDTLKNPLKVKGVKYKDGQASQRYIGKRAEVVINPETKRVISVNPTSSQKARVLMRKNE